MSYWTDDRTLDLDQRRRDADQAEAAHALASASPPPQVDPCDVDECEAPARWCGPFPGHGYASALCEAHEAATRAFYACKA